MMNKPITLCDRCDIVMSCLLNYDGKVCRKNRTVQPTNADRIRAMSDEELADFLFELAKCECPERGARDCVERCGDCWLTWLREDVKEA